MLYTRQGSGDQLSSILLLVRTAGRLTVGGYSHTCLPWGLGRGFFFFLFHFVFVFIFDLVLVLVFETQRD